MARSIGAGNGSDAGRHQASSPRVRREFAALPPRAAELVRSLVSRVEAVAFVLNCNRLELVGTQDEAETRELCEGALTHLDRAIALKDEKKRETLQTYDALSHMHKLRGEQDAECVSHGHPPHHALVLTPPTLCRVHGVLMKDLVDSPGVYRKNDAFPAGYDIAGPHRERNVDVDGSR